MGVSRYVPRQESLLPCHLARQAQEWPQLREGLTETLKLRCVCQVLVVTLPERVTVRKLDVKLHSLTLVDITTVARDALYVMLISVRARSLERLLHAAGVERQPAHVEGLDDTVDQVLQVNLVLGVLNHLKRAEARCLKLVRGVEVV